jgi:hypothetical protein
VFITHRPRSRQAPILGVAGWKSAGLADATATGLKIEGWNFRSFKQPQAANRFGSGTWSLLPMLDGNFERFLGRRQEVLALIAAHALMRMSSAVIPSAHRYAF